MILKIILVTLGLIVIGLIKEVRTIRRVIKDIDFLSQYNKSYVEYMDNYFGKSINSSEERKLHVKLISEAPKAQRLLMDAGLIDYQPAFAGYYIKNYPVLINTLQSLRNPITTEEFSWVNSILIMQISRYEELYENIKSNILNPVILLREGVQFLVTLPISLLYWTGLIKYSTQYKLSNNFFIKFISFLILLIGFISSIFTIILGWEQFKNLIYSFF